LEDRGDLDPAPPAHGPATAAAAPPETGLGGPGTTSDPASRDTESPSARAAAAGTAAGHCPAAVLPGRPGVPGRTAAPAPRERARSARAADPPSHRAALARRPAGAPPPGRAPAQEPGPAPP